MGHMATGVSPFQNLRELEDGLETNHSASANEFTVYRTPRTRISSPEERICEGIGSGMPHPDQLAFVDGFVGSRLTTPILPTLSPYSTAEYQCITSHSSSSKPDAGGSGAHGHYVSFPIAAKTLGSALCVFSKGAIECNADFRCGAFPAFPLTKLSIKLA